MDSPLSVSQNQKPKIKRLGILTNMVKNNTITNPRKIIDLIEINKYQKII
jgi:hypothetical protein